MPWIRGRRSSRSAHAHVRRAYKPLRCPDAAYSRTRLRPGIRTPGVQAAMLTTLVALLLAAVPFSKWLDMRLAAGALRDADLTQAITATDIADYQKRLAAAREATGASAATIATLTIQVAGELSKESDRKVMCLSVLDAAASITQTSAGSDTPPDLVDHFAVVKDRLHEMYRKQGHPAGSDASGPDQYAHCASDAARR